MEEGLDLTVDVPTAGITATGQASFGGGSGVVALVRQGKGRGLFGKEIAITEPVGCLKAALCPACGEISVYLDE